MGLNPKTPEYSKLSASILHKLSPLIFLRLSLSIFHKLKNILWQKSWVGLILKPEFFWLTHLTFYTLQIFLIASLLLIPSKPAFKCFLLSYFISWKIFYYGWILKGFLFWYFISWKTFVMDVMIPSKPKFIMLSHLTFDKLDLL